MNDEPILGFFITPDKSPPIIMGVEHDPEKVTVAEVLDWFEIHDPREGGKSPNALKERRHVRGLFRQAYGHLLCEKCRPFMLIEFIKSRKGLKSNWSKKRWATTIVRPFSYAARMGLIRWNPFSGCNLEQGEGGRDWQQDEYQLLLAHATPEFRRVLIFIRVSGMRPGEIAGLEWDDVDLETKTITLPKEKTKAKRVRHIPINKIMAQMLEWIMRNQDNRPVRLHQWPNRQTSTTHVFRNSHGGQWKTNAMTKQLRRIRQHTGISSQVKIHSGRHAFATNALMAGVDLFSLMNLLGHRDIATTQRYLHLSNKCKFLADAMERAINGDAVPIDPKLLTAPPAEPLEELRKAAADAQIDLHEFLRGNIDLADFLKSGKEEGAA